MLNSLKALLLCSPARQAAYFVLHKHNMQPSVRLCLHSRPPSGFQLYLCGGWSAVCHAEQVQGRNPAHNSWFRPWHLQHTAKGSCTRHTAPLFAVSICVRTAQPPLRSVLSVLLPALDRTEFNVAAFSTLAFSLMACLDNSCWATTAWSDAVPV